MKRPPDLDEGFILGVDPGLSRVGWGIIDGSGQTPRLVEYGHISTRPSEDHAERLLGIYETLREVITRLRPATMAIEEVFQGKSAKSAMLCGEGRAACILAGATAGIPVLEYAAPVVKLSVTGNGRAAKVQVQGMVSRLLGLDDIPRPHDAADALAVALTHYHRR